MGYDAIKIELEKDRKTPYSYMKEISMSLGQNKEKQLLLRQVIKGDKGDKWKKKEENSSRKLLSIAKKI